MSNKGCVNICGGRIKAIAPTAAKNAMKIMCATWRKIQSKSMVRCNNQPFDEVLLNAAADTFTFLTGL